MAWSVRVAPSLHDEAAEHPVSKGTDPRRARFRTRLRLRARGRGAPDTRPCGRLAGMRRFTIGTCHSCLALEASRGHHRIRAAGVPRLLLQVVPPDLRTEEAGGAEGSKRRTGSDGVCQARPGILRTGRFSLRLREQPDAGAGTGGRVGHSANGSGRSSGNAAGRESMDSIGRTGTTSRRRGSARP